MSDQDVDNKVLRMLLGRRRGLLSYIRVIVRDFDLAEDVFQEVCVAVLRRKDEIVAGDGLDAYFRKVARHAALAALEKRGRTPSALSADVLESLDNAWTQTQAAPESGNLEMLRRCVEKLPPRSQQLLKHRYEGRLTGKNLADRIGSTPQSAYVALSRIHRALRECVGRGRPQVAGANAGGIEAGGADRGVGGDAI